MASTETLKQLAAHPEWIAPRSDLRVFLGEPGAPEATKTTVEPGNAFSPGMKSFGVTWWLRMPDTNTFFAPEEAPLEALTWRYAEGYLPVIHCSTSIDDLVAKHILFQVGSARQRNEVVSARLKLSYTGTASLNIQVFMVLRSLGPAGGPLENLTVTGTQILSRNHVLMALDRVPSVAGCGVGDPSELARFGDVPEFPEAQDDAGWCYALLRYDVSLEKDSDWVVHLDCPLIARNGLHEDLNSIALSQPESFDERYTDYLASWRDRYAAIDLDVPDSQFRNAFLAGLGHMLIAVVGDQARIAALSYPLPWLRDSIFIIRCMDLAGQHELARAATEYCIRNDFFGGFGAEGDAPGQGIWAIVQHYLITLDLAWLRDAYPAIRRKADCLYRMRRTTEAIQITVDTPVLPFMHADPNLGVICVAARDGIIHGAMDHGIDYSLGWVNQWALCGLTQAALAAEALGQLSDATAYRAEAAALRKALQAYANTHPKYFSYARTMNSVVWPTRAWSKEAIEAAFDTFWQVTREQDGHYLPEPYWLYFELAQAHNALLLGNRQRAWQVLDYRLQHQDLPGLYGFREGRDGVGTENAVDGVTLVKQLRGCQEFECITPHGWSQSEFWLLQRAMLVTEDDDNQVRLFAGIPQSWLDTGQPISFRRFPSHYGLIDASVVSEGGGTTQVAFAGVRAGTNVLIDLPETKHALVSDGSPIELELS